MTDETKIDFMQMLSCLRVIDDDDRVRKFGECIESQYQVVASKVTEYKRDGSLTITLRFQPDKKNKNGVNVFADVTRKIPKGSQCNSFYADQRTGGLYYDDPNQMRLFKNNVSPISGKDKSAQNTD